MAGDQLLDLAKRQWYHFTAIVIAGMGFFTDAYNLFGIFLATKLLGRVYYHVDGAVKPGTLPPIVSAAVNGVYFSGMLAGQLFFGWLGDKLGRKVYGITLMMMVICSIASGLSFGHTPKSVMAMLCFFRFWLGFGIGGDCLFSAMIMSKYAIKKTSGAFIAAVFAMQGFGILAGGIVAILVSASFKAAFPAPDNAINTVPQADYVWRIILMSGALPAALTYYWRMKMPETALVAKNAQQAASDMSKVMQVEIEIEQVEAQESGGNDFGLFAKQFLRLHLLGTTTTWFLLYSAFYSQNLFSLPLERVQSFGLCFTVVAYWFTFGAHFNQEPSKLPTKLHLHLDHYAQGTPHFEMLLPTPLAFSVGQRNFHNGLNSISSSMLSTKRMGIVITFVTLALLIYACSLYHVPNFDSHYQRQQASPGMVDF